MKGGEGVRLHCSSTLDFNQLLIRGGGVRQFHPSLQLPILSSTSDPGGGGDLWAPQTFRAEHGLATNLNYIYHMLSVTSINTITMGTLVSSKRLQILVTMVAPTTAEVNIFSIQLQNIVNSTFLE